MLKASQLPTGVYLCRFAQTCNEFNPADTVSVYVPRLGKASVLMQKFNSCTHGGGCYEWRVKLEAQY